jgi:preprotein translocase subunit SecD
MLIALALTYCWCLASLGAVLTLPGIAGIVLTMGTRSMQHYYMKEQGRIA